MAEQPLITNACLLAMDGAAPEQGLLQVLIEDGRIAAIGRNLTAPSSIPVMDAEGGTAMCGNHCCGRNWPMGRCMTTWPNCGTGLRPSFLLKMPSKALIDENTLFIHGNILTKEDLIRMRDAGAAISVTPESEMQMQMGTPIWPLAKEVGVRCGLGADIVSGGSGDLFTQMRLALAAGRMAANDKLGIHGVMPGRLTLTTEDALRAVTIDSARVAGLDKEVGSIEVGKKADQIILKIKGANMSPVLDPIKAVVMQAGVADVDTVMVQGRLLKSKGRLVIGNQEALASRLQSAAERI